MQYYIFHPVFAGTYDDNAELMNKFMAIGESYGLAMEAGASKIKQLEGSPTDAALLNLVMGFKVTVVAKSYAKIVEKIVARFGFELEFKDTIDQRTLSMVALLMHRDRFDIIDQVISSAPSPMAQLKCNSQ